MRVERFNDSIEFMPECPNGCEVDFLPPVTRHVAERTAMKVVDGNHRWLVCCPKCYMAYFALKSTGTWGVNK